MSIVHDKAQETSWWDFETTRTPTGLWVRPNDRLRVDSIIGELYKIGCEWDMYQGKFWVPRVAVVPFMVWAFSKGYRSRRTAP